jgi:UDP-N-acetylmuramoyl-L-alanyl-D-glutamate--2,6-diaminopimelate ligase
LKQKHDITQVLQAKSIKDIAFHSGSVVQGGMFFVTDYKEEYMQHALSQGAAFIVSKEPIPGLPDSVENIIVDDVRVALGEAAAFLYPEKPKYMVAVTGTNGKSSIVDYFRQICGALGIKAASIGTMGVYCTDLTITKIINNATSLDLTTPDVITMHKILNILAKAGVNHVAFEASSHGIEQLRVGSIPVQVAIFTNFSQDHLDYHRTMEEYKKAKLKLFSQNLTPDGTAIIFDEFMMDPVIMGFLAKAGITQESGRLITVGKKGNFSITKAEPTLDGQTIEFTQNDGRIFNAKLDIVGSFQATNIIMAIVALSKIGINIQDTLEHLHNVKAVCGRLERVTRKGYGYHVFVDYAHKPNALENTLSELKSFCTGRLVVVFGCGGNRDTAKRKIMGEIAARIADIVIVTDDNPRMEDPATIRKQVMEGCPNAIEIGSRGEAIAYGVGLMGTGDILLVAGKGHEDYQIIGKKKIHFDDIEEVKKYI